MSWQLSSLHCRGSLGIVLALVACLSLAACQATVRAEPLRPSAELARAQQDRMLPATPPLTLADAVAWMRRRNPDVREARADLATAHSVAAVPTPLANPVLDVGPLLLGGADVLAHGAWGLEAALGWLVPLAGAERLTDAVNQLELAAAQARTAAVEREQYLALRGEWAVAALWRERIDAQAALVTQAEQAVSAARSLAQAGEIGVVDLHLLDLDARRARADELDAQERRQAAQQSLARRLGCAGEGMEPPPLAALPSLPGEVLALAELRGRVGLHHPRLAVLRSEYMVAEKRLRLECANALPGLGLGFSYEREDKSNRFGLPLGIELPIFDRNQVGIARARAERARVRARYAAQLDRILGELESAHAQLLARAARSRALEDDVAPAAREAAIATRQALAAGQAAALQALEVQRAHREIELDVLDARMRLLEAWSALEQAAGLPLLRFPDEPTAAIAVAEGR